MVVRGVGGQREVHKRSLFEFATYVEFANLPFENGGILSLTPLLAKRSLMLNALSAIKLSPLLRSSMRPLSWTILRSLVLPDHGFEMKVKAPPTNNLSVLWCL